MKPKIVTKKHRLEPDLYKGSIICSFTICIEGRENLFTNKKIFNDVETILLRCLKEMECVAYVYLFMPDHIHLTIEGKSERSDLLKFVNVFKQRSGYYFYKNRFKGEWQKSFYDHILRKDEDIVKHVRYILGNPVRKGIVANWKDYPFKGSTVYDFAAW